VDRTLIFFAMPGEAGPFLRAVAGILPRPVRAPIPEGAHGARRFVLGDHEVWVTGVGPANADRVGRIAIGQFQPARVITAGVAGALDPAHRVGEVFHDAESETGLDPLLHRAGSRRGRIVMRDRIAVTAADKAALRAETGADLVEMESAALRGLAFAAGIPSATVRAVSDTAGDDLPLDFNAVYTPDMRLSPFRLGAAIARAPWTIPGLIRLGGNARTAAARLAAVLVSLVQSPGSGNGAMPQRGAQRRG
jgi:adenosylhomocysteine nucleosidase